MDISKGQPLLCPYEHSFALILLSEFLAGKYRVDRSIDNDLNCNNLYNFFVLRIIERAALKIPLIYGKYWKSVLKPYYGTST